MPKIFLKISNKIVEEQIAIFLHYNKIPTIVNNSKEGTAENIQEDDILLTNQSIPEHFIGNVIHISDKNTNYNGFYLEKPIKLDDLLKNIDEINNIHQKRVCIRNICLELRKYKGLLFLKGGRNQQLELTDKEADLLKYLMISFPKLLGKENLLEYVWGITNRNIYTQTLETHISNLRKKLNLFYSTHGVSFKILKEDRGYKLEEYT